MMKRCKLTVLRTTLQEDLAEEYGIPGPGRCPLMREGQARGAWARGGMICPKGISPLLTLYRFKLEIDS